MGFLGANARSLMPSGVQMPTDGAFEPDWLDERLAGYTLHDA
jgi:hypothetical protein